MSMSESVEKRVISFVSSCANRCVGCMRRGTSACGNCQSAWANEVMADIEADRRADEVDYSVEARRRRIVEILRSAGRPLLSREIDISDIASNSTKEWTLGRMIRIGQIVRVRCSDAESPSRLYRYSLAQKRD